MSEQKKHKPKRVVFFSEEVGPDTIRQGCYTRYFSGGGGGWLACNAL